MPLHTKITATVKKHLASIEVDHDKRVAEAEARARRKLDKARTKQERELALLQLQREKLALSRELSEAKLATQKAKTAAQKARKEAGDLTFGERISVAGKRLGKDTLAAYRVLTKPAPKRRRKTVLSTRRKSSVRRP